MALPCVVAAPRGPGRAPPVYCAAERPEPVTPPPRVPALDHGVEGQTIEYPAQDFVPPSHSLDDIWLESSQTRIETVSNLDLQSSNLDQWQLRADLWHSIIAGLDGRLICQSRSL